MPWPHFSFQQVLQSVLNPSESPLIVQHTSRVTSYVSTLINQCALALTNQSISSPFSTSYFTHTTAPNSYSNSLNQSLFAPGSSHLPKCTDPNIAISIAANTTNTALNCLTDYLSSDSYQQCKPEKPWSQLEIYSIEFGTLLVGGIIIFLATALAILYACRKTTNRQDSTSSLQPLNDREVSKYGSLSLSYLAP